MPAAQQNNQQQQNENSLDFLWLIVIVLGAIVLTWVFGKDYIAAFVYKLRLYEIIAVQYTFAGWQYIVQKLSFLPFSLPVPSLKLISHWQELIIGHKLGPNLNDLQAVSTAVGSYLRYPMVLLLFTLAFIVYTKNVALKFKNTFTMKRLKMLEMENWPQITPISKLNLIKQDINEGPWAMARTPMQFCKQYNLIDEVTKDEKVVAELRKGDAYNVFVMQLGPFWTGPDKLPIHVKALFGIFASCAERDRDSANKLLQQISKSAAGSGKLDFSGAKKLFEKYYNTKETQKVVYRHAYVITVMASMLQLARTDGVLGSAEFLWLKPLDRRLWYMLNSVGRQTAVPEVGGAFAHWLAECKLLRALRVPMVDEAVRGLETALTEIIYEPEEE